MATEVEFHTEVGDKLPYACRLLRKAYRQGLRVAVAGDAAQLQRLDQALWVFEPEEFIPHVRLAAGRRPAAALARTPICLVEPGVDAPHRDVLVNLGPAMPAAAGEFKRVVELVAAEPEDAAAGRLRWRQYKAEGWNPVNKTQGPKS